MSSGVNSKATDRRVYYYDHFYSTKIIIIIVVSCSWHYYLG